MIGCNQVPFFPPDVAGWPANDAWLSTSSAQVRLEFATNVACTGRPRRDRLGNRRRPTGRGRPPARCRRVERNHRRDPGRCSRRSRDAAHPRARRRPSTCWPEESTCHPSAVASSSAAPPRSVERPRSARWVSRGSTDDAGVARSSSATSSSRPNTTGTLVLVTLYGGNDALNTVVPVADPQYAALRGTLALDPATTLPLSEGFALHPALPGCKELWDSRQLAVVHGVGFDEPRSQSLPLHGRVASGLRGGRCRAVGSGAGSTTRAATALDAIAVGRAPPTLDARRAALRGGGAGEQVHAARLRGIAYRSRRDVPSPTTAGRRSRSPLPRRRPTSSPSSTKSVRSSRPIPPTTRKATPWRAPDGHGRGDDRSRPADAGLRGRSRWLRHARRPGRRPRVPARPSSTLRCTASSLGWQTGT